MIFKLLGKLFRRFFVNCKNNLSKKSRRKIKVVSEKLISLRY